MLKSYQIQRLMLRFVTAAQTASATAGRCINLRRYLLIYVLHNGSIVTPEWRHYSRLSLCQWERHGAQAFDLGSAWLRWRNTCFLDWPAPKEGTRSLYWRLHCSIVPKPHILNNNSIHVLDTRMKISSKKQWRTYLDFSAHARGWLVSIGLHFRLQFICFRRVQVVVDLRALGRRWGVTAAAADRAAILLLDAAPQLVNAVAHFFALIRRHFVIALIAPAAKVLQSKPQ